MTPSPKAILTFILVHLGITMLFGMSTHAADLIFAHGRSSNVAELTQIQQLAEFYGLNVEEIIDANSHKEVARIRSLSKHSHPIAMIITVDSLIAWHIRSASDVQRIYGLGPVPILVLGITDGTARFVLQTWSGGTVKGCTALPSSFRAQLLRVGDAGRMTRQLTGIELPATVSPTCSLEVASNTNREVSSETILTVSNSNIRVPLLVRTILKSGEVFYSPRYVTVPNGPSEGPSLQGAFSSMAPLLLFLSYAAGDYAWHLPFHYANLTIDDAWLKQPFGSLDYKTLLPEMERHNFHLTIAFVPWNFDRSDPDLTKLFRLHAERFSVSIHGNNHAHREFGSYRFNPLAGQILDIKQAVARMERFTELTGVPYDRFMIFPHGVAPDSTFAELRRYDFLGTANGSNVPLGSIAPDDPTFILRPYTDAFSHFLSFTRYPASAHVPKEELAIQTFFGNPILFYDHADLFHLGVTAFDSQAGSINRLQPDTKWTGLGDIARHTYLLRRRSDTTFDVRMLSTEIELANPTDTESLFYVQLGDVGVNADNISVDGNVTEGDGHRTLQLMIPAKQVRTVRIQTRNDFDPKQQPIEKGSVYVWTLRMLSDFRDVYLERWRWGRALARAYYEHNWDAVELDLEHSWWMVVGLLAAAIIVIRHHRSKLRVRRPQTAPEDVRTVVRGNRL